MPAVTWLPSRHALLRRALRLTHRTFYGFTVATGTAAAVLARAFRALGREASPLTILLQAPILVCWLFVRPVSLASFAACAALTPRL